MNKYKVTLSFNSERDAETIRKFFVKALAIGKIEPVLAVDVAIRSTGGRTPVMRSRVRSWVAMQNSTKEFTARGCADAVGMSRSAAWKALQLLVTEGVVTKNPLEGRAYFYRRNSKFE